jgi:uncharacterized membrane protein YhaH (DUF805 family)
MDAPGPPPNHRVGRQRFLIAFLRVAVVFVFLLGLAGLVLPTETFRPVAITMVVVLVVTPVIRVGWLVLRWLRLGDVRFALAGGLLLAVMGSAFALAH